MTPALVFIACGFMAGALSWAVVRFVPAFKGLLAIALPFIIGPLAFVIAFVMAEATASCEPQPADDCGQLLFVAIGLVSMLCAGGAFVGAVGGGALAWRDFRDSRRKTTPRG